MLRLGMSLILAVRDDRDVVVASDGRVLGEDLGVMSNDSLKTLALNATVCLGMAGSTDVMRLVLGSLGIKCRGSHPIDLLGVCQEVACPVDVDYRDARDEVTSVLRWMTRRVVMRINMVDIAQAGCQCGLYLCKYFSAYVFLVGILKILIVQVQELAIFFQQITQVAAGHRFTANEINVNPDSELRFISELLNFLRCDDVDHHTRRCDQPGVMGFEYPPVDAR